MAKKEPSGMVKRAIRRFWIWANDRLRPGNTYFEDEDRLVTMWSERAYRLQGPIISRLIIAVERW